jgi:hypothetical protein
LIARFARARVCARAYVCVDDDCRRQAPEVERRSILRNLAYIRAVAALDVRAVLAGMSDAELRRLVLRHTLDATADDSLRLAIEAATRNVAPAKTRAPWPQLPTAVVFCVTQWCDVGAMMRL